MTPEVWWALVAGLAAGAGVATLLARRKVKREVIARTLVPHRTRQLMSAMQSGAVVVRRDRRAAYGNQPAAALGIARPDGALHEAVADLAERAWQAGAPVEEDVQVRRGVLGAILTVHVRVTPLDEELALAVANDNTEQRAAEQTRREFAVNVSHELKTPVGALSLLAETVEAAADEPEVVKEFARKIRRESRRLTKLIQEIIEISRLQGGDSPVNHEEVEIAGAVAEAVEAAKLAADARSIELAVTTKARPVVLGDRDLLVMAIRNLIDNAVAYSEPGKRVAITTSATDDLCSVAVIDQGIGIDPADQEHIFERFFRTDPARSRETGGTGLGLSIVKHVALQHAGSIGVWSQPSVGSTFTLKLPLHREVDGHE